MVPAKNSQEAEPLLPANSTVPPQTDESQSCRAKLENPPRMEYLRGSHILPFHNRGKNRKKEYADKSYFTPQ